MIPLPDFGQTHDEQLLLFENRSLPGVSVVQSATEWSDPQSGLLKALKGLGLGSDSLGEKVGWDVVHTLGRIETMGDERDDCYCGQNPKIMLRILLEPGIVEWYRGKFRAEKVRQVLGLMGVLNHSRYEEYLRRQARARELWKTPRVTFKFPRTY